MSPSVGRNLKIKEPKAGVVKMSCGSVDAILVLNSTGDNQMPVPVVLQKQQINKKAMVCPLITVSFLCQFSEHGTSASDWLIQHRFLFIAQRIWPLLTVVARRLTLLRHSHQCPLTAPSVMLLFNFLTVLLGHDR